MYLELVYSQLLEQCAYLPIDVAAVCRCVDTLANFVDSVEGFVVL